MRGHTGRLRQRVNNKDLLVFGCIVDARSGAAAEAYHEAGYDVLLVGRSPSAFSSESALKVAGIRVETAEAFNGLDGGPGLQERAR